MKKRNPSRMTLVHTDEDHQISSEGLIDDCVQIVLFNDDHNTSKYVIKSLMIIFKHSQELARKLMLEAHMKGKTIVQVESRSLANLHVYQLKEMDLKAVIESIT